MKNMEFDFDKLKVDYKKEDKKVEDKNDKLKELMDELTKMAPVKELFDKRICIGPKDLTTEMAACAAACLSDYKGDKEEMQKLLAHFTCVFVSGMFLRGDYIAKEDKENEKFS